MRKTLTTFLMIGLFALMMPMFTTTAAAANDSEFDYLESNSNVLRPCRGSKYRRFYRRNRNALNVALGAGIGTIIGSIVDGKRGALIGAGAGTAGGLLYTYKLNPKTNRCQKVYYRRG